MAVLEQLGVHPRVLFTPEHGLDGSAQAQVAVSSPERDKDDEWSRQVISLYGETKESLSPTAEQLDGIDILVIDLADVGSRYYTYVWTALLAARVAAAAGVHTLLLDRPNPISGDLKLTEGAPQAEGFTSFVGLEPVPIRHGLTAGELLAHFLSADGKDLGHEGALSIVPTRGWERHATARRWGRPFVPPSPNMPTVETALVYPGGCFLEGTNLSEGRGTTTPFQSVGAPFLNAGTLTEAMRDQALPGLMVRPHSFEPTFDKHAGKLCHGVMLHVTDERLFRPVETYLTLIQIAHQQAPEKFAFSTEPYEFETEIPAFDLLTGSDKARQAIVDGAAADEVVRLITPVPDEWLDIAASAEGRAADARA